MAEPTFLGRAYIWGLDGTLLYSGMAAANNEPQSLEYRDEYSRHDTKDKKGDTVCVILYNANPKLTIDFMPFEAAGAGTGEVATAKTRMVLPPIGAKVTVDAFPPVVGSKDAAGDTINSAKWLYLGGGSIRFSPEAEVVMSLPLEKFATDLAANAVT